MKSKRLLLVPDILFPELYVRNAPSKAFHKYHIDRYPENQYIYFRRVVIV